MKVIKHDDNVINRKYFKIFYHKKNKEILKNDETRIEYGMESCSNHIPCPNQILVYPQSRCWHIVTHTPQLYPIIIFLFLIFFEYVSFIMYLSLCLYWKFYNSGWFGIIDNNKFIFLYNSGFVFSSSFIRRNCVCRPLQRHQIILRPDYLEKKNLRWDD